MEESEFRAMGSDGLPVGDSGSIPLAPRSELWDRDTRNFLLDGGIVDDDTHVPVHKMDEATLTQGTEHVVFSVGQFANAMDKANADRKDVSAMHGEIENMLQQANNDRIAEEILEQVFGK